MLFISGCAMSPLGKVADGGAIYRYEKQANGCKVEIISARDIAGGSITIDEQCKLTTKADSAGGGEAIKAVSDLVKMLK